MADEKKHETMPATQHSVPQNQNAQRQQHDEEKKTTDARKKQTEEREKRSKDQEEHRKSMRGRPTPTQEEADLIKTGHHPQLEPDGSTDPFDPEVIAKKKHGEHVSKQSTAESGGASYSTRQSTTKTAA